MKTPQSRAKPLGHISIQPKAAILALAIFVAAKPARSAGAIQDHDEAPRVTRVQLTPQVDANLRGVIDTSVFRPYDTIHAVVWTSAPEEGREAVLRADWRYGKGRQLQSVHSEGKAMVMSGPGITMFQVSKPDGWPAGHYYIEISLNGVPVRGIAYEVR